MVKVYVELDRHKLKQNYFERIVGKIISKVSGCESSIAGPLATRLGITYDTQKEFLQMGKPTFMRVYMESLIDTIDNSVEEYMVNHNGMFRIPEDKVHLANEAATDEVFAEDNGDGLGETLSDMVNEMLDKKVEEIKDVAKLVLRLEKQKQDGDKESLLDENAEVEEEDKDDANADFDGEAGEGEDSEASEDGEGGNPFGEDSGDGDFAEGDDGSSEEDDNPFGDSSTDESGDNGESGGDNPFDAGSEEGSETEEGSGDGGNPFEGGESSEEGSAGSEDEGSAEGGTGNPFESVQEISKITIGGRTPFYGLKNGDMTGFVTGFTRKIFEAPMREAFDQFGQESVQFKELSSKFAKTNKAALESLVGVVSVGQALGFKLDFEKIKAWDLYLED